jgi:hypothetical protein
MPRKPIDYQNTYFYKIVCRDLNVKDLYIGHTTDFQRRKSQHHRECCNNYNSKHFIPVCKFIRANGGWENWDMILIECCFCIDGNDVRKGA